MISKAIKKIHQRVLALRLPKTLLMNNVNLDPTELKAVLAENAIERTWYRDVPPFDNLAQILAAVSSKRLVAVTPTENYAPILRLRNPKLAESYPGYLTPGAKSLLDEVAAEWRKAANEAGIDPHIRLAVTSLIRTYGYQQTIVKAGKLADPDSVHTRGEAFDIDGCGYYLSDTPVNPRRNRQEEFEQAFTELDAHLEAPRFGNYDNYNAAVHSILIEVIGELQAAGRLHFVVEYKGTNNQAIHICRNPEYQP